jgi:pantetheine-phosphate adenylyltransferase
MDRCLDMLHLYTAPRFLQQKPATPLKPSNPLQLLPVFEGRKKKKETIAVVAGSYDPPTNGHLWLVDEARKVFDKVLVVMAVNPDKRPTFNDTARAEMFQEIIQDRPGVSFHTIQRQFLVDFAKQHKATALIRGVRNATDLEQETALSEFNRALAPNIPTMVMIPPKDLQKLSSSFVRGMVGYVGWRDLVRPLVPPVVMTQLTKLYLTQRWDKLAQKLGLDPVLAKAELTRLTEAYGEKSRYYHTMDHIIECLEQLDKYLDEGTNKAPKMPEVLELSLWFHDVVDERGNPQGVEQSAEKALAFYQTACKSSNPEVVDQLKANVMITKHFAPKSEVINLDTQLMHDIDLSILGQASKRYKRYQEQILKEYGPLYGAEYASGRAKVMQQFLDRPQIYLTDWFKGQYERSARRNIAKEIAVLKR